LERAFVVSGSFRCLKLALTVWCERLSQQGVEEAATDGGGEPLDRMVTLAAGSDHRTAVSNPSLPSGELCELRTIDFDQAAINAGFDVRR
jgi:hypothetical protein